MMNDGFSDPGFGFTRFLPLNEGTFTRLEQYACMYHNWHVYDFLLTKVISPTLLPTPPWAL